MWRMAVERAIRQLQPRDQRGRASWSTSSWKLLRGCGASTYARQHSSGHLAGGFVDRHHAPGMKRGRRIAIVIAAGEENFVFRVQHGQLAGVSVEFHFAT